MKPDELTVKGTWQEVVDSCRNTVGKDSLGKEPSAKFKRDILIAEHSPIRCITIRWKWKSIKSWIATHFSRHKWECYIRSQRTDRTGIDRDKLPQDARVDFIGEANIQHLIDTMRKRLCMQASKETREYAEGLKAEIAKHDLDIARVLVPSCVYRCACPEINPCARWHTFASWCNIVYGVHPGDVSISERYCMYADYEEIEKEEIK